MTLPEAGNENNFTWDQVTPENLKLSAFIAKKEYPRHRFEVEIDYSHYKAPHVNSPLDEKEDNAQAAAWVFAGRVQRFLEEKGYWLAVRTDHMVVKGAHCLTLSFEAPFMSGEQLKLRHMNAFTVDLDETLRSLTQPLRGWSVRTTR